MLHYHGISEPIAPKWIPDGFELVELTVSTLDVVHSVSETAGVHWVPSEVYMYYLRKVAHVVEFAVLGFLAYFAVSSYTLTRKLKVFILFVIGISIPIADETIQLFVPGRSSEITDVILDMTGALLGTVFALTCVCLLRVYQRKKRMRY